MNSDAASALFRLLPLAAPKYLVLLPPTAGVYVWSCGAAVSFFHRLLIHIFTKHWLPYKLSSAKHFIDTIPRKGHNYEGHSTERLHIHFSECQTYCARQIPTYLPSVSALCSSTGRMLQARVPSAASEKLRRGYMVPCPKVLYLVDFYIACVALHNATPWHVKTSISAVISLPSLRMYQTGCTSKENNIQYDYKHKYETNSHFRHNTIIHLFLRYSDNRSDTGDEPFIFVVFSFPKTSIIFSICFFPVSRVDIRCLQLGKRAFQVFITNSMHIKGTERYLIFRAQSLSYTYRYIVRAGNRLVNSLKLKPQTQLVRLNGNKPIAIDYWKVNRNRLTEKRTTDYQIKWRLMELGSKRK